ncbi:MAG: SAM-dependent methyltransferase [Planctomycetia bacterium]|nr:SAM-dependent methyltransferase [Planctomycetia bacterium]
MTRQLSSYIFMTCQPGAENALKNEMNRLHSDYRFSYSRPGFLTFRLPENWGIQRKSTLDVPKLQTVFARCCSHFLGKINAKDFDFRNDLIFDHIWKLCLSDFSPENPNHHKKINRIHVWEPDATINANQNRKKLKNELNGSNDSKDSNDLNESINLNESNQTNKKNNPFFDEFAEQSIASLETPLIYSNSKLKSKIASQENQRNFEPGLTSFAKEIHSQIYRAAPAEFSRFFSFDAENLESAAIPNEICLDCVLVSKTEFWIGYHLVHDFHSRYPGGLVPLKLPFDATSRAWLKFEEGLRWSNFPIEIGSHCVDIGASPGGGSQALLARGAYVLGVDPAEMAPIVLNHPNFTHLRAKINQLKRKIFRKSRWFLTDMNVAPNYTLDALEEIVSRSDISPRGLLFTLKLFDWKLAENIPEYVQRIKNWGFPFVKVRQLLFNHQEVMICCSKKIFDSEIKMDNRPRRR